MTTTAGGEVTQGGDVVVDDADELAALLSERYHEDGVTPNRLTLHRLRYISVPYTDEQADAISAAWELDAQIGPPMRPIVRDPNFRHPPKTG